MGCCFSKKPIAARKPAANHLPAPESSASIVYKDNDRAPPPVEEETVKEVLSETPNPNPSLPRFLGPTKMNNDESPELPLPKIPVEEKKSDRKPPPIYNDETSEISEVYSLSESISTTTVTEKKDEENGYDEVKMEPRVNRSPAKHQRKRSLSGDFSVRREPPVRRSDPSPGRTPLRDGSATRRRISGNGIRRDSGDDSGRRSRSPSARRDSRAASSRSELNRSCSGRKTGRSPRKSPAKLPEGGGRKTAGTNGGAAAEKESLENPLVSLECFIFL